MKSRAFVLTVRLHEPRFHGQPEWPPAPARAFQALVAGASLAVDEDATTQAAFRWLESLEAPVIAAPESALGAALTVFVPNNDLDALGGDPEQLPAIRTSKHVQPRLLVADDPLVYVWCFAGDTSHAETMAQLARGLYQLGRGVDMAFAEAQVTSAESAEAALAAHRGAVFRPTPGGSAGGGPMARGLAVPCLGTFDSLRRRHAAQGDRFQVEGRGKKATTTFVQAPKARFREVGYECPPDRFVFELRPVGAEDERFAPWPLRRAYDLVVTIRDAARARLATAVGREAEVDAVLVGTRPGEEERIPQRLRARLIPLPSIGHEHADPAIRRIVVEVPQGGPFQAEDLRWAFSGLSFGERVLIEAGSQDRMLDRYAAVPSRRWQSVTAVALPAIRRRIEPTRQREEAKDGQERLRDEAAAAAAVRQALRHAGVRSSARRIRVTREPTMTQGARAEAFASLPRFRKEGLWHVQLDLDVPTSGPLVIGDGRFLGLGVMCPVVEVSDVLGWAVVGGIEDRADPQEIASHFRRAVLARAGAEWGERGIPSWISGHGEDGLPARGHRHICVAFDPPRQRLLVFMPRGNEGWLVNGRNRLAGALAKVQEIRAGRSGILTVRQEVVGSDDPLIRPSLTWMTVTKYVMNRHDRAGAVTESVAADVRASLGALEFPTPIGVEVTNVRGQSGIGVTADVRLNFAVAVEGPLLLGRTRHGGGGLFAPADVGRYGGE